VEQFASFRTIYPNSDYLPLEAEDIFGQMQGVEGAGLVPWTGGAQMLLLGFI